MNRLAVSLWFLLGEPTHSYPWVPEGSIQIASTISWQEDEVEQVTEPSLQVLYKTPVLLDIIQADQLPGQEMEGIGAIIRAHIQYCNAQCP